MQKLVLALSLALIISAAVFPTGQPAAAGAFSGYPLDIVATTGMVGDIVAEVVGTRGSVFVLMDAEIDPHLFRPTRADIARMQRADLIFYNGLNLEGQMNDTLVQLARTRPVFAVTELIEESILLDHEEYADSYDPHLWMDVALWMRAVDAVAESVVEYDPSGADYYRGNAERYRGELELLDAYARDVMATIPPERRYLVTAHDAFGYLGAAYDIAVIGVQGLSTESEAGLEDINSLVSFLVEHQVSAVFAETTVADRALMAVIEGAASRGHRVAIGGELFSDAMGSTGSYEGTYIGMIDHNVTTVVRSLGGTAPERGFRGMLSR